MILIKNIEFIEVDRDPYQMASSMMLDMPVRVMTDEGAAVAQLSEIIELVKGRRFVRPSDGVDIVVGISKQAEDILGLQYEAWENMENELRQLRISYRHKMWDIEKLNEENEYLKMPWWKKLFGFKK